MKTLPAFTIEDVNRMIARLDEKDRLIIRLIFEAKSDVQIAAEMWMSYGGVRHRQASIHNKLKLRRCGRYTIVWFYVQFMLATDMEGVPLNKEKERYTEHGEKLAEWKAWAEGCRNVFLEEFNRRRRVIEAITLLTNPANVDKTDRQLGALMQPPVSASTYHAYVRLASPVFGGGGRVKIIAGLMLAPIGA